VRSTTIESMSSVNLLLVDDKVENLVALEQLLAQPDRTLFRAGSGNDALRLLLKHEFAVVLLDVEMPGMDGYEVAQLMRGASATRLVPIIFVTAADRSEEQTFRGYEAGAVDFLYKPVNPHTLNSKVGVFIDLYRKSRELERANVALARASAELTDRITDLENVNRTLAHDLRAPLRSIRSFSAILAEALGPALEGEAQDALHRVVRSADRMWAMIDDLYALLKLSSVDAVCSEIDAGAVLDGVLDGIRSDVEKAGAAITRGALPRVRGHRTLLAQVLQNLIANAIKFRGPDAPAIRIDAARDGDAWRFAVRDNGIGIRPADRERIFGLFERNSSNVGGTGVGLTLCRRAIEKLGGRIWVGDEPGPGSTFYFTLPDEAARRAG
jgi:two-component system sensor histidine kinase/response regulator